MVGTFGPGGHRCWRKLIDCHLARRCHPSREAVCTWLSAATGYILTSNSGRLDGSVHVLVDRNSTLVLSHGSDDHVARVGQIDHAGRGGLDAGVAIVAPVAIGRCWRPVARILVVAVARHTRDGIVLVEAVVPRVDTHQGIRHRLWQWSCRRLGRVWIHGRCCFWHATHDFRNGDFVRTIQFPR